MLWPPFSDIALQHGTGSVQAACKTILSFTPSTLPEENEVVVQFALTQSLRNPTVVAESLCHAATVWKDTSLWIDAVTNTSKEVGFAIFSDFKPIWNAVQCFGFEAIEVAYAVSSSPSMTFTTLICFYRLVAVLDHEPRNTMRFKFLDALGDWLDQTGAHGLALIARPWITSNAVAVLNSLHKPTEDDDSEPTLLVAMATKYESSETGLLLFERYV